MAGSRGITRHQNADIDAILSMSQWDATNLTFSFPTSVSRYTYDGEPDGFQAATIDLQAAVREALSVYSAFTPLTFTEVTEVGLRVPRRMHQWHEHLGRALLPPAT